MTPDRPGHSAAISRWDRFWFADVAPDIFSVLRILFGLLGCFSLLGLLDFPLFWSCQGLVASRGSSLCQSMGDLYPRSVLLFSVVSFVAMALGWYTRLAVVGAFASVFLIARWNNLPLSAAHQVLRTVLFCLVWADCGRTYSVDAWLARKNAPPAGGEPRTPIWPLRLLQIQVAAVYLVTGLWKLNSVMWRDGTALHYVFENPQFRRFAVLASPGWDSLTTWATYGTLAWELSFAFLVFHPRTRRGILAVSVVMHLGVWAALEVGPFSWMMMASYIAFLDPEDLRRRLRSVATAVLGDKTTSSG
jgi:hypothetical protein